VDHRVPKDAAGERKLLSADLCHRCRESAIVLIENIALLSAGAADEDVSDASGGIQRRRTGSLGAFIVGVSMDLEEREAMGHSRDDTGPLTVALTGCR
jgi:hypothetical protein